MLRRYDFLVAEYENLVLEVCLTNSRDGHPVEWLGEIQTDDLGAQRIGQQIDFKHLFFFGR